MEDPEIVAKIAVTCPSCGAKKDHNKLSECITYLKAQNSAKDRKIEKLQNDIRKKDYAYRMLKVEAEKPLAFAAKLRELALDITDLEELEKRWEW